MPRAHTKCQLDGCRTWSSWCPVRLGPQIRASVSSGRPFSQFQFEALRIHQTVDSLPMKGKKMKRAFHCSLPSNVMCRKAASLDTAYLIMVFSFRMKGNSGRETEKLVGLGGLPKHWGRGHGKIRLPWQLKLLFKEASWRTINSSKSINPIQRWAHSFFPS